MIDPMRLRTVSKDVLPAEGLLEASGQLRLLPASTYDAIPVDNLRMFCHNEARYGLPTQELVAWLGEWVYRRRAIEIGAGWGDLSYYLGIPATDNRMQEWPEIKKAYELMRQPVIRYPDRVDCIDGVEAVRKYKPEVVVASWVTQWVDPATSMPLSGNIFGVKENEIIEMGVTYILIGNAATHRQKNILNIKHEEFRLPFIRSRSGNPQEERVWIWNP